MYIRATKQQQTASRQQTKKVHRSKAAYANTDSELRNVHFSFEATLLYELINKHGDISDQLLPWYFPEAYLQNAELALNIASKIVDQAKLAGIHMDLNFVFNEIRELNQIQHGRDNYQVHSSNLAVQLKQLQQKAPEFQPERLLTNNDREILEMLHRFATQNRHPLSQVEDFALLYAISKWENQRNQVSLQLSGNTAKHLVENHLGLIEPQFVPLLIDFYKMNKGEIAARLA